MCDDVHDYLLIILLLFYRLSSDDKPNLASLFHDDVRDGFVRGK